MEHQSQKYVFLVSEIHLLVPFTKTLLSTSIYHLQILFFTKVYKCSHDFYNTNCHFVQ